MHSTWALARPLGQREEREPGWLGCQAETRKGEGVFIFFLFIFWNLYIFKSILKAFEFILIF